MYLWHRDLHDLLVQVGAEQLNEVGVAALGYPAVLATEQYEVIAIRKRLSVESQKREGECPNGQ